MKFIPIMYQTEMVQALKAGTKTQTRRTKGLENINTEPDYFQFDGFIDGLYHFNKNDHKYSQKINCPYGSIGDVLWVRESFYEPIFEGLNGKYYYKADLEKQGWDFKWKPSIYMPKEACRFFFQIENISVERLHDITENDAINEGILLESIPHTDQFLHRCYRINKNIFLNPLNSFYSLWSKINGVKSWNHNPWVWVIQFKKIDKPQNFL